jgi:transposase-like protein
MKIHCHKCKLQFRRSKLYPKNIIRKGIFYRQSDRKKVQRFYCKPCHHHFSVATFSECYRQKKRHLNSLIVKEMVSVVSLRECHRKLKINRKTVSRKLAFMAKRAQRKLEKLNKLKPKSIIVEFDDMETFEHTKCKPLSITIAVESKSRWILGFEVSQMPCKGLLAKTAMKKYGFRKDLRSVGRSILFRRIRDYIKPGAIMKSDENPHYVNDVQKYFGPVVHKRYLGRQGAVTGQGELKKVGFDPLFSLNHTCAVMRARVSRLIRRTWNTTKKPERLVQHLALAVLHHNLSLKIPLISTT